MRARFFNTTAKFVAESVLPLANTTSVVGPGYSWGLSNVPRLVALANSKKSSLYSASGSWKGWTKLCACRKVAASMPLMVFMADGVKDVLRGRRSTWPPMALFKRRSPTHSQHERVEIQLPAWHFVIVSGSGAVIE